MMIVSSPNIIVAPGKPNKKNLPHRKEQLEGKGDHGNCFFYAAKLATDWAPISTAQQENYRRLCLHRKKIAEYANGWYKRQTVINVINGIAEYKAKTLTSTIETKKWIIGELPNILTVIKTQKTIREGTDQVAKEFIEQFACSSLVNLESFAAELVYKERLANHGFFLCQVIPQFINVLITTLKEKQKYQLFPAGNYEKLPLQKQYHLMHELFIQQAATIFDFELASWNPLKSIKVLKALVETKGPLVAGGKLGEGCTTSKPVFYKTDQLYDYYKWNSTNYQNTEGVNAHFVTVIKVEEAPEEYVGFLDPADGSKIAQKRKVYMLPYQIFCQSVSHSSGLLVALELDSYLWCRKSSTIESQKG